ncbi:flavin reductase [Clostridiales Family XIII bacterium RF-744-FAT-WT-3]|uniref:Flavin reductase n=1 Tax=Baileyella intestinalis TaxID=2606709 RepID=A0A6A8M661_9FIRM|nr:flavin reductase [Baileyella intestinalis]MST68058.1 flavin reductase [Baileyella intestinalis]
MENEKNDNYDVFNMFKDRWALVAAGDMENHNACTVGWGSMGTLWSRPGHDGRSVIVYLHPSRYTRQLVQNSDYFTVSFFPDEYKKALGYMGSHSGRNEDKVAGAGLTPVEMGESIGFKEAQLTFVCRKLYQHMLSKDDLAPEIQEYYKNNQKAFPLDENGDWQPHWVFVGEVTDTVRK